MEINAKFSRKPRPIRIFRAPKIINSPLRPTPPLAFERKNQKERRRLWRRFLGLRSIPAPLLVKAGSFAARTKRNGQCFPCRQNSFPSGRRCRLRPCQCPKVAGQASGRRRQMRPKGQRSFWPGKRARQTMWALSW